MLEKYPAIWGQGPEFGVGNKISHFHCCNPSPKSAFKKATHRF
jgi:hypothetical protein